ncbi:MAG: DUF1566 domain-containing protein [bacterium]|nr:DUF1566 domain-containing protein [bacterium]
MRYHKTVLVGLSILTSVSFIGCGKTAGVFQDSSSEVAQSTSPETAATPTPDAAPKISIIAPEGITQEKSLDVIRRRLTAEQGGETARKTPKVKIELRYEDQTVAAQELGIMWTREAAGVFEFSDSDQYCESLKLASYSDWRLPRMNELQRLLSTGYFPSSRAGVQILWTATPHSSRGMMAYDLSQHRQVQMPAGLAHVVCVRHISYSNSK